MHGIQRDCPHFLRQVIHIVHHVIHNHTIFGALSLCITCGRRGPRLHTPVFHSTAAAVFRRGQRQDSGAAVGGRQDSGAGRRDSGGAAAAGGLAAGHGSAAPKGGAARDRDEGPARPGSGRARVENGWKTGGWPATGRSRRPLSAGCPGRRLLRCRPSGISGEEPGRGPGRCAVRGPRPACRGTAAGRRRGRRATRRARGSAPP